MTTSTIDAPRKARRHRVLAGVAGAMIGLGAALMLVVYGVVVLTWVPLTVGLVAGAALAVILVSVLPMRHGRATGSAATPT